MSRNFYVRTRVKFTFATKIEAMHERSLVSVKVEPRPTSRLSSADVSNALSQQSSKQEMTCPGTPMERSHVNEKLRGLYLPGFPAGSRVRQTAFEAHHNLTTVSHRGVRKTLSALQSRYY